MTLGYHSSSYFWATIEFKTELSAAKGRERKYI
jgi:hypothetical protein